MILVTDKTLCCGCSACSQACPADCIKMEADGEGFLYPHADKALCIECGQCERVCPVIQADSEEKHSPAPVLPAAYGAAARDARIRRSGSSGGIFAVLAEHVAGKGGRVFGAAFTDGWKVHHTAAETAKELEKLKGSKYLQSDKEDTFRQVKELLKHKRMVLYSGTPCEIAGLKAFVGREDENLYCLDILCHGVPSPLVWDRFLKEKEAHFRSEAVSVSFRDKTLGWRRFSTRIGFGNGQVYACPFTEEDYMQIFLHNVCLRPSCYACRFKDKDLRRPGDLTLGDFWGVENVIPDMDDDRGVSLILVNSRKGERLLTAVRDKTELRPADAVKALAGNPDAVTSVRVPQYRERFFKALSGNADLARLMRCMQPTLWQKGKRKVSRLIRRAAGKL